MFTPSLFSLSYLLVFNRSAFKLINLRPGNPLYLLLGALIPAAIAFITLALCQLLGWGSSTFMTLSAHGAEVVKGPWLLGTGMQGWPYLLLNVVATAIAFAGLNGVVALGEEFGWRGVLQHHLIERLGYLRGVVVLGFAWAMWHLPINLAGYNYADSPTLGALVVFPLELIAVSFIMAWLTVRARSFWPAVLMHGSGNGIEEGVVSSLKLIDGISPLAADYIQVGITVVLALLCLLFRPSPEVSAIAAASNAG